MALEGLFRDLPPRDLFRTLQISGKSGVLVAQNHEHRGILYIRNGHIIDAVLLKAGSAAVYLRGDGVIGTVLRWREGSFVFRQDLSTENRPICIVHEYNWNETASPESLTGETLVQRSPEPPHQPVALSTHEWLLLSLAEYDI